MSANCQQCRTVVTDLRTDKVICMQRSLRTAVKINYCVNFSTTFPFPVMLLVWMRCFCISHHNCFCFCFIGGGEWREFNETFSLLMLTHSITPQRKIRLRIFPDSFPSCQMWKRGGGGGGCGRLGRWPRWLRLTGLHLYL